MDDLIEISDYDLNTIHARVTPQELPTLLAEGLVVHCEECSVEKAPAYHTPECTPKYRAATIALLQERLRRLRGDDDPNGVH